jgi:glucokinase
VITGSPPAPRLVADLGGTNGRVVVSVDGSIPPNGVTEVPVRSADDALALFRRCMQESGAEGLTEAAIAVAGSVDGDAVKLTNGGWWFSAAALKRDLGLSRIMVVNDFVGVALCVPHLAEADLTLVGRGTAHSDGPIVVLGAGTGLGVASLMPTADGALVLPGEGGHGTISPADSFESEVIELLRDDAKRGDGENWLGHVSAERVLSGPGLVNLCRAVHRLAGVTCPASEPHEVTALAERGDGLGIRTLQAFCSMMGTFAGNLALAFGATGGIYVAGGVVPRFADFFASSRSGFRTRFESKGRLEGYLQQIPTFLITRRHPALLGLAMMGGLAPVSTRHLSVLARGYEA